ncbi:hypothetical protein EFW17_13470 [Halostreptopolyspora alba]|uniref:Uncharacterized protein n=1 Tax=Halostreptopolyspora alba TaxID=2487137 RepID=A0A3N0E8Q6_9ACTN|nr:hypothetical protein EFW17_13470 [Nocardiopsaceae bacterium YIM 96095]
MLQDGSPAELWRCLQLPEPQQRVLLVARAEGWASRASRARRGRAEAADESDDAAETGCNRSATEM